MIQNILIAALMLSSSEAYAELLTNGSFESGTPGAALPAPWTTTLTGTASVVASTDRVSTFPPPFGTNTQSAYFTASNGSSAQMSQLFAPIVAEPFTEKAGG